MTRNSTRARRLFVNLFALIVLIAPLAAQAADENRVVNLPPNAEITGDYYDAGSLVNAAGPVSGDLMTAGASVDITSSVGGDVLAAGGTVNLSGKVGGDVRVLGGNLNFSGKIGKNLTAAGGTLKLASDSQVFGNAYLAGGTVLAGGANSGNLLIGGGHVELSGKVAGSVTVYADYLSVLDGADIAGALTYYSENQAVIASSAVIKGGVTQKPALAKAAFKPAAGVRGPGQFGAALWKILAALVIALIAWRLWPKRVQQLLSETSGRFWEKLLWGLLILIAVPIGAIIIAVTVVGLPLAGIVIGLYLIGLCLAGVLAFLNFGKWLGGRLNINDRPEGFPWYTFFLGAVVLSVIAYVPVLGPLVCFVVWLWSLGALYRSLW